MVKDFKISYCKNPVGLDEIPRFSWKIESSAKNVMQSAYRLQVRTGTEVVWDTDKVVSAQSIGIHYEGIELTALTPYQVSLTVWSSNDEQWEERGEFETGLLGQDNWRAEWITHELPAEETACPIYVRKVRLDHKRIKRARIYATACGVYEIELNGKKVGDAYMAPGWTSYHKRLQYQTYPVTDMLKDENEISITVANGWYKGELGFDIRANHYGDRTALRAMLLVEYTDGSVETFGTDTDWEVFTGAIRSSEIYHGETVDYTGLKKDDYLNYTSIQERLGPAVLFDQIDKIGQIVAQESEPVRITKRFPVRKKMVTPKGELVLDFGQNLTGLVEVKLPPLTGDRLTIRYAETLDEKGNFFTDNLRGAKCTDTFIYTDMQVDQVVMPRFTFHGFRYIALDGVADDVNTERFISCAMHTDMVESGSFECDNELINQLQSNITWGQRSNFLDIPTDCPQRDERLGWTGDAQVFCNTASYNFQTMKFFEKWLHDVAAETSEEFGVPHVVPNILGQQEGAAAWSDCATIMPWNLYQTYGDPQILESQYESMKIWVQYIRNHCDENGLWMSRFQYGDWLALDIENGSIDRTGGTDKYLVANAYYAYSTRILRDTAEVLKREADSREYGLLYERIIEAINAEFVTSTGRLVSETQTACVLMLHLNLVKPEHRGRVMRILEENVGAHRNHLTTGFVGTPFLCHCLSENGRHDLAEEIFLKEDFPGWLYAVKLGATTIWERWNSVLEDGSIENESGMNSLNHYAYGSIGEWMYRKIAGINPLAPGYKRILIKPLLTHGMSEVRAEYDSAYGVIKSGWSCRDGKLKISVTIPANTTAKVIFPENNGEAEIGSGTYEYEFTTTTELALGRYTFDSTFGELVRDETGRAMFESMAPGMLDNPMIKYAFDMTISELIVQAPEGKPLYEAVIAELNRKERAANEGNKDQ